MDPAYRLEKILAKKAGVAHFEEMLDKKKMFDEAMAHYRCMDPDGESDPPTEDLKTMGYGPGDATFGYGDFIVTRDGFQRIMRQDSHCAPELHFVLWETQDDVITMAAVENFIDEFICH